jgi:hypothetical protein
LIVRGHHGIPGRLCRSREPEVTSGIFRNVNIIMESVYVMTGREIYRDMTKFWGKLFGIMEQLSAVLVLWFP